MIDPLHKGIIKILIYTF